MQAEEEVWIDIRVSGVSFDPRSSVPQVGFTPCSWSVLVRSDAGFVDLQVGSRHSVCGSMVADLGQRATLGSGGDPGFTITGMPTGESCGIQQAT